jgi:ADP-heptose:LPS heptosyltransferase
MLTTPLLAALSEAFPDARFDWAVSDWARRAIASNPRVTELISVGEGDLRRRSWRQIGQLILHLRAEHYDTAFITSRAALLSYIAWQAGIHQRIGLNVQGRGFANTISVRPPIDVKDKGSRGLLLAEAVGVERTITGRVNMEYYPPDRDRTAVTRRLIEEVDWLGDVPLVLMHPGGGESPVRSRALMRWPVERFVILGNHLARTHKACIVLVGAQNEKALADDIAGMMATRVTNYCGQIGLGEIGALCEVADLYVGNDTGPSHIAAASGCQTLVLYGPTNPSFSKPYSTRGNVHILWHDPGNLPADRPFTWELGVTAEEAMRAADGILGMPKGRAQTLAILSGRPS